jgi:large subunit ribosomal protein L10
VQSLGKGGTENMPNAKILKEKQAIVANLSDKLKSAGAVFVDYTGTNVAADTEMRRAMRAEGVEYSVVKNTLTRKAAVSIGLDALDPILNGPTALAVSPNDPVAAARIINKYATKKDATIVIKAGLVEGKILNPAQVTQLAELPSREALIAQVLGTMIAPVTSFVRVLDANISGLARVLNQIAQQKAE